MISVTALTGGIVLPSSRFRVRQYIEPLQVDGIRVKEFLPFIDKNVSINTLLRGRRLRAVPSLYPVYLLQSLAKILSRVPGILASWKSDVTWLERSLFDGALTLEWALPRNLVLDVDDAIWQSQPFGTSQMKYMARRSELILAGNTNIANWFCRYNKNIKIIPTAVDTNKFRPMPTPSKSEFIVGWTGTSGNLIYLYEIRDVLKRFFEYSNDARLLVVCDEPPALIGLPENRVIYHPWSEAIEASSVQLMDVGLMPLPNTEWARSKCSFKMIQYMACGKPVVVSPVGMNVDVMRYGNSGFLASTKDEWMDALVALCNDRNLCDEMGFVARNIAVKNYSVDVVASMLRDAFVSMV